MKRRILWIPHTSWDHAPAQRPAVLIDKLRDRFEIHIATWHSRPPNHGSRWSYYLNPLQHLKALSTSSDFSGPYPLHKVAVTLPCLEAITRKYPPDWARWLSQIVFRRSIRKLHRRHAFAAMICCPSHRLTGYPPRIPGVPRLYDYLDLMPPDCERYYVKGCERTVCVSHVLGDKVSREYGVPAAVIPNGVHLDRIRQADGLRARTRWNLERKRVVSLIGLTCSERLYFLDALANLRGEFPDLVFVGAGGGRMADLIAAKARILDVPTVMTGWVPPEQVADLFAASDVGLYPGDDNSYYDSACPIKILEYVASGVPVVCNRTAEIVKLELDGVDIRNATVAEFTDGIRQVLHARPPAFADMSSYDWTRLAARFGDEIESLFGAT